MNVGVSGFVSNGSIASSCVFGGWRGWLNLILFFSVAGDVTHLKRDEDALLVVHAFEPRVPSLPLLVRRVFVLRCVRVGFERVDDGCEPLAESPRLVEAAGDWVVP